MNEDESKFVKNVVGWGLGGMLALIILFGSWTIVSPGEVGVIIRLGSINRTVSQGFNLKIPLIESVDKTNIQTQKEQTEADAASSDLQNVQTTIAVNYNVTPDKVADLYAKVGTNFGATIIDPAIQEVVKSVTAKFTAEELITKRAEVTDDVKNQLIQKLQSNDITVSSVSIVNFNFSKSFNEAIEAKVTAEQNALAAKNKLDQVKYEADQRIAEANGEAQAIKIQATAIEQQGGAEYIQLQALNKWDGHLPQYMTGPVPFVNLTK